MKKLVVGIIITNLIALPSVSAEISVTQLSQVPAAVNLLSSKYETIAQSLTKLTEGLGRVNALMQDDQKSYGDKFVEIALFLNRLSPVLETIVGSSKSDVLGHKENGILTETNRLLELFNKKTLSPEGITQLQDAVSKLEDFSKFLTNSAQNFKSIIP